MGVSSMKKPAWKICRKQLWKIGLSKKKPEIVLKGKNVEINEYWINLNPLFKPYFSLHGFCDVMIYGVADSANEHFIEWGLNCVNISIKFA